MIRKLVLLFVQRYLWKKLLKGSIKSKIWTVGWIFLVIVLAGAAYASFNFNMSFVQGIAWAWTLITNGLGSLIRF